VSVYTADNSLQIEVTAAVQKTIDFKMKNIIQ
jgi:hypothetical protein